MIVLVHAGGCEALDALISKSGISWNYQIKSLTCLFIDLDLKMSRMWSLPLRSSQAWGDG